MPFSALSPEGPVSLLGVEAATLEALRARNRRESCFTAKCCGSPVVIRTAHGKAPHFVHKVASPGCDSDRRETPEHRRLKQVIAESAARSCEWEVQTEALQRDAAGKMLWRADVLASKPRGSVAFEVQLSNADYEAMRQRQARYKLSGVRGLWFVRTRKGFPASKDVPIFPVESSEHGDWVSFQTRWDHPDIWRDASGGSLELKEFVEAALNGQLKWAPFENHPETLIDASIFGADAGRCASCGRTVVRHHGVRARIRGEDGCPDYVFPGPRDARRRSHWYAPLVGAVWSKLRHSVDMTLPSAEATCCFCSSQLDMLVQRGARDVCCLSAELQLGELPKPKFGTVEQDWLRRWVVLGL